MIEQLEYRLANHIQEVNKPLQSAINRLSISTQKRSEPDQAKQDLLQDIDEKIV